MRGCSTISDMTKITDAAEPTRQQKRETARKEQNDRHRHNEVVLGKRLFETKELLWWLQANQLTIEIDHLDHEFPGQGLVQVRLLKDETVVADAQSNHRQAEYSKRAALGVAIGRARSRYLLHAAE